MSDGEIESILRTLALACHHLDDGESRSYAELFTDGAVLDAGPHGVFRGRGNIEKYARERAREGVRHFSTNERIRVGDASAEVESYLLAVRSEGGRLRADRAARCHDRLLRDDRGRWRLASRSLRD